MRKFILGLFLSILALVGNANAFPERPVKVVVPVGPGGGLDIFARIISKNLSELWKVPVIVENRPGASGVIGSNVVIESPPDGHTLLLYTTGSFVSLDYFEKKENFFWERDLTILSMAHTPPFVLVTSSKSNVKNLKELEEKTKKNGATFGSTAAGSPLHVYGEFIADKINVNPIHTPYKAMGQAIVDVINGNLDFLVLNSSLIQQHVQSGAVSPLLVFNNKGMPEFPNTPNLRNIGASEMGNLVVSYSFMTNSKVSEKIKEKLISDIFEATNMSLSELREKKIIDATFNPTKNFDNEIKSIIKTWKTISSKIAAGSK